MRNGGVVARWRTALERETLGFNLLRSNTNDRASAARVNATLIEAVGSNGGSYEVRDANGQPGSYYWIEEIELSGAVNVYGPAQVATADLKVAVPVNGNIKLGGEGVTAAGGVLQLAPIMPAAVSNGQSVVAGDGTVVKPAPAQATTSETQPKIDTAPGVVTSKPGPGAVAPAPPVQLAPATPQTQVQQAPASGQLAPAEPQQTAAQATSLQRQKLVVVRGAGEPAALAPLSGARQRVVTPVAGRAPSMATLALAAGAGLLLVVTASIGTLALVRRRRQNKR